jgi:hypothetical protein
MLPPAPDFCHAEGMHKVCLKKKKPIQHYEFFFPAGGKCNAGIANDLVPGWNPRKAIRAIALGLEQEVTDSKWPWVCTLGGP